MPQGRLRVVIVEAGLAGPCLAHGLVRAGIGVALYERAPAVASRGQGYRIHLEPEGARALRSCLPPDLYDLAVATSARGGSGLTVLSSRLEVLHHQRFDASAADQGAAGIEVDRLRLRLVLLAGLEDVVHFGSPFTHYQNLEDGTVRAHFAGGVVADADLLVAADGADSRVRAQLLPQASVTETGQLLIFGKIPLTEEVRGLAPPPALDGFPTVVGSGGRFLVLAGFQSRTDPAATLATYRPGVRFPDTRDYVMWVFGAPAAAFGAPAAQLFELDGGRLLDVTTGLLAGWHPDLVELLRRGDPTTVTATAERTAAPLKHWRPGPVTLVGGAIHCMVPAGIGAAVALRDAGLLAVRLNEVAQANKPLTQAVEEYETEMLDYGFAAVAASQRIRQHLVQ